MEKALKNYLELLKNKTVVSTTVVAVLFVVALIAAIVIGFRLYGDYNALQTKNQEIEDARTSVSLIQNNKTLVSQNIDEYNKILEKLIPDKESYFLVITALEQLAARTGIRVISYTIDLSSTTEEKLTLEVEIEGDLAGIENFMKEYRFTGGRLITNEKLSLSLEDMQNITFSLNFFHKEFQDGVEGSSVANKNDIKEIEDIAAQL